jgi:hypothetical protein
MGGQAHEHPTPTPHHPDNPASHLARSHHEQPTSAGAQQMSKSKHGKIDGQFVPLLHATLDCPAWKAASHGATALYIALRRRVPRERNRAFISYRDACKALGSGAHKIREWFAELEHYGFIVQAVPGSLGVDGKGRAPHWRLTELGNTSKASADGVFDPPSRDYLRWDGVLFDPKPFRYGRKWGYEKQNPVVHVDNTPLSTSTTPPLSTSTTPKTESVVHGVHIERESGVVHGVHISSVTTPSEPVAPAPTSPPAPLPTSSDGSLEEKSMVGPLEGKSNVVEFDPRIAALEATERRRRLR